jgi:Peptidase family M3
MLPFPVHDVPHLCAPIGCMVARLLISLVLLSATVAENPTVVAARLDGREKQLENLYAEYWRTEYKIAIGEQNLSSRPIQEQIRTVVSDDTFLRDLDRTNFSDPLLKTRRKLFLNEAVYTRIANDPALTAVVEQITQQENTIRYKVGDRQLTRAELTDLLAHNPDRNLREQAWRATSQITAANGERIQNAIKLRNQLAGKYSSELFSTFMLQRKGMKVQTLFEWFEDIREQTEPEYQRLLERMRRELGVAKIEPWDLEFYFSHFTNGFESQKFSAEDGWTRAKQLTADLGYNLDPVEMHVADLSFGGAAYPVLYGREVKILANRYSGTYFYDRLLHATGHALHYQMMAEPSFLLRNNYAEPMDEGLAQVIALMLYRPEVNTKLFALTPEQASIVGETYRLKTLFTVRNTIADSLSEFEAYADPDQDPSGVYNRIHAEYLGVDMHDTAVWAFNPMYGSDPIYLQSFVVGEMVAHQIQHKTDQEFGKKWGKTVGEYLKTNFYCHGAAQSMDSLMRRGTGEPVTPRYLIQFLQTSSKRGPFQNRDASIKEAVE